MEHAFHLPRALASGDVTVAGDAFDGVDNEHIGHVTPGFHANGFLEF